MLKEEMRKIFNKADIAQLNLIGDIPEDEYDLEIKLILEKVNKNTDIFTLKNIIYDVFTYSFDEGIIYDKNNVIYNNVAKEIYNLLRRE